MAALGLPLLRISLRYITFERPNQILSSLAGVTRLAEPVAIRSNPSSNLERFALKKNRIYYR